MNIEEQYLNLLDKILTKGKQKADRTGVGTLSVFGEMLEHDFKDGFPAMTTKKLAFKTVVKELLWFLNGDTHIKTLLEQDCHIWSGDAYKHYKKSNPDSSITDIAAFEQAVLNVPYASRNYGDLGPIYGKQWRNFKGIDQIQRAIDLLTNNPDSRDIIVSAWNVAELDLMTLKPCHFAFQFYTTELDLSERTQIAINKFPEFSKINISVDLLDALKIPKRSIDLMWHQRSCDMFLGVPFNIASYGVLLNMFAKLLNMVPNKLKCTLGDAHIYANHLEAVQQQLKNKPQQFPTLQIDNVYPNLKNSQLEDFKLIGYNHSEQIKAKLNN